MLNMSFDGWPTNLAQTAKVYTLNAIFNRGCIEALAEWVLKAWLFTDGLTGTRGIHARTRTGSRSKGFHPLNLIEFMLVQQQIVHARDRSRSRNDLIWAEMRVCLREISIGRFLIFFNHVWRDRVPWNLKFIAIFCLGINLDYDAWFTMIQLPISLLAVFTFLKTYRIFLVWWAIMFNAHRFWLAFWALFVNFFYFLHRFFFRTTDQVWILAKLRPFMFAIKTLLQRTGWILN